MPALLSVPITAAVANVLGPVLEVGDPLPPNVGVQGKFTYGSGGTNVTAYVQTSFDGGATWTDVAVFQFLLASARLMFNLSALTPVTTQYTPTDGTLAVNTAKDGLIGSMWRVKYTSTGTYAGNTTLEIDLSPRLNT